MELTVMMKPMREKMAGVVCTGLLLFFQVVCCQADPRGMPAQEGITNFGKVSERLYRGARPDAAGLTNLHRLGVRMIIDLRMPDKHSQTESAAAQVTGLTYTNIPLRGLGRPADDQVRKVLALIEACPHPVFLHCEHGCDRTGTIIACYRLQHDQWSCEAALREAAQYGLSKLERGMKRFIQDFAQATATAKGSP
jgi:protein tyrosine/serine phosphatase